MILHEVSDRSHSLVPLARGVSTGQIAIEVPCFAPGSSYIANSANITCAEGDLIRHNTNCTPLCDTGYTADVETILCQARKGRLRGVVWCFRAEGLQKMQASRHFVEAFEDFPKKSSF